MKQRLDGVSKHPVMVYLHADHDRLLRALAKHRQHSLTAEVRQAIAAWILSEAEALTNDEDPGDWRPAGALAKPTTPVQEEQPMPLPRTSEERRASRHRED